METAETAEHVDTGQAVRCTCRTSPFVTVAEVADVMGLTPEYFYAGLRENRFPGTKFGRIWKMPKLFIEAFLDRAGATVPGVSFEEFAQEWLENLGQVKDSTGSCELVVA